MCDIHIAVNNVTVSQFGYSLSKPVYNCSLSNNVSTCHNHTSSTSHESDLAVVCRNRNEARLILSITPCNRNEGNTSFRLIEGPSQREGRVEVCVGGCWMTACNNNDEGIAEVICEQLGYPRQGTTLSLAVLLVL